MGCLLGYEVINIFKRNGSEWVIKLNLNTQSEHYFFESSVYLNDILVTSVKSTTMNDLIAENFLTHGLLLYTKQSAFLHAHVITGAKKCGN